MKHWDIPTKKAKHSNKFAIFVAGGNGTGKTTLIKHQILPKFKQEFGVEPIFINADEWQKNTYGSYDNATTEVLLEAQNWATNERQRCIEEGESFVTETVFSHPSKVEVLKQASDAGFFVVLYHIGVEGDGDTAVKRVEIRKIQGGHDVPPDKIKARLKRANPLIAEASKFADMCFVYDNSVMDRPHKLILCLSNGEIAEIFNAVPQWVESCYPVESFRGQSND